MLKIEFDLPEIAHTTCTYACKSMGPEMVQRRKGVRPVGRIHTLLRSVALHRVFLFSHEV